MTTNQVTFNLALNTIQESIPKAIWNKVDWIRVMQIVQEAIPLLSDMKGNFMQLFLLAKELYSLFQQAEQTANMNQLANASVLAINWSQLISVLLPILLEFLKGLQPQTNDFHSIVTSHPGTYQLPIGPNDLC